MELEALASEALGNIGHFNRARVSFSVSIRGEHSRCCRGYCGRFLPTWPIKFLTAKLHLSSFGCRRADRAVGRRIPVAFVWSTYWIDRRRLSERLALGLGCKQNQILRPNAVGPSSGTCNDAGISLGQVWVARQVTLADRSNKCSSTTVAVEFGVSFSVCGPAMSMQLNHCRTLSSFWRMT